MERSRDIGACLLTACSLIVCQSADDLKAQAQWDGALGGSRHILLEELSSVSLESPLFKKMADILL